MADKFDWNSYDDAPSTETTNNAPVEAATADFDWNSYQNESAPVVSDADKNIARQALKASTSTSPLVLAYGAGKTGIDALRRALFSGEKQDVVGDLRSNIETGSDAIAGGMEGATMGGMDEASGALVAGAQKLGGNNESFFDLYRKNQKAADSAFNEAEARSPTANLIGNVGGSVAGAVATGGLGVEAALGKKMMATGLKQALKGGAGATAKELLKQGAAAAVEGAITGGIQGGLSSDKDFSEARDLAGDVTRGATFGLIGGGVGKPAMSVAGEGIERGAGYVASKLKTPFKNNKVLGEAFELGMNNKEVDLGPKASTAASKMMDKDATDLLNKFNAAERQVGQEVSAALQKADASGVKIPIQDELSEVAERLAIYRDKIDPSIGPDREFKSLLKLVFELKDTELTPGQVQTIKNDLLNYTKKPGVDSKLEAIASNFSNSVNNAFKEYVPELAQANEKFTLLKKFGSENIAERGSVEMKLLQGFKSAKDVKTIQGIKWALANAHDGDVTQFNNMARIFEEGLTELETKNPGVLNKLGLPAPDKAKEFFVDAAKRVEVIKRMNNVTPWATPPTSVAGAVKEGVATAVRGTTPLTKQLSAKTAYNLGKLSNSLNQTAGVIPKVAKKLDPKDIGRKLTSMSDEALNRVAEQFMLDESSAGLGRVLRDSLQNKGNISKNAAIFQILNSKVYRQKFRDAFESQEEGGGDEQ
tara:strand:+ start:2418 stop:4535 length:2118 start_codon:yes stop_codon:yes gene_type:complete